MAPHYINGLKNDIPFRNGELVVDKKNYHHKSILYPVNIFHGKWIIPSLRRDPKSISFLPQTFTLNLSYIRDATLTTRIRGRKFNDSFDFKRPKLTYHTGSDHPNKSKDLTLPIKIASHYLRSKVLKRQEIPPNHLNTVAPHHYEIWRTSILYLCLCFLLILIGALIALCVPYVKKKGKLYPSLTLPDWSDLKFKFKSKEKAAAAKGISDNINTDDGAKSDHHISLPLIYSGPIFKLRAKYFGKCFAFFAAKSPEAIQTYGTTSRDSIFNKTSMKSYFKTKRNDPYNLGSDQIMDDNDERISLFSTSSKLNYPIATKSCLDKESERAAVYLINQNLKNLSSVSKVDKFSNEDEGSSTTIYITPLSSKNPLNAPPGQNFNIDESPKSADNSFTSPKNIRWQIIHQQNQQRKKMLTPSKASLPSKIDEISETRRGSLFSKLIGNTHLNRIVKNHPTRSRIPLKLLGRSHTLAESTPSHYDGNDTNIHQAVPLNHTPVQNIHGSLDQSPTLSPPPKLFLREKSPESVQKHSSISKIISTDGLSSCQNTPSRGVFQKIGGILIQIGQGLAGIDIDGCSNVAPDQSEMNRHPDCLSDGYVYYPDQPTQQSIGNGIDDPINYFGNHVREAEQNQYIYSKAQLKLKLPPSTQMYDSKRSLSLVNIVNDKQRRKSRTLDLPKCDSLIGKNFLSHFLNRHYRGIIPDGNSKEHPETLAPKGYEISSKIHMRDLSVDSESDPSTLQHSIEYNEEYPVASNSKWTSIPTKSFLAAKYLFSQSLAPTDRLEVDHPNHQKKRDTLESQEEELLNVANDVSKERTTVNRNPSTSGAKSKGVTSPLSVKKINQNYQTLSNTPSNLTTQGSHYNQAKFKEDSTRLNELCASGAGEEEENSNLGMVHFGLSYDFQSQNLIVKIIQAKALPAKDITGTSDPYVRLFLLPDRKSKMETRVKKKILNPIWNETFLYEGFPYHKLQNRILNLQVYDYDRFSRDDPIGEVFLPLNEVDLSQFPHYWKKLIPMDKSSKTGEILLTLTYLPGPGKLNIEIIKCKNLKASDVIGLSDPYITIWLMENGKKLLKQKTQIKFNTLSPVFQETFTFDVPTEKIRVTSLLITAKDYDKYTRNDILGSFLLASRSSPMEMKHWKDMLLNPGKPITQWHFFKKN